MVTSYPSPLPVDQPLHPVFRDHAVVLRTDAGLRTVSSSVGPC